MHTNPDLKSHCNNYANPLLPYLLLAHFTIFEKVLVPEASGPLRPFLRKSMESDKMATKGMKVQISSGNDVMSGTAVEFQGTQGGLNRQPSMTKTNCLCSPTTHAGSFRCRLHRIPSLQRTKSMESPPSLLDQASIVHATGDANKD